MPSVGLVEASGANENENRCLPAGNLQERGKRELAYVVHPHRGAKNLGKTRIFDTSPAVENAARDDDVGSGPWDGGKGEG